MRLRKRRPVEPALAVHVRRDDELARERTLGAGGDRDVGALHELEDAQRVRGGLLERLVAVGRRDAEELELRAREGEQQRDRVVVPRIAVEDDGIGTAAVSSGDVAGVRDKVLASRSRFPRRPWRSRGRTTRS